MSFAIHVSHIRCATPGESIDDMAPMLLGVSRVFGRPVHGKHNGVIFEVEPDDTVDAILSRYWAARDSRKVEVTDAR